MFKKKIIKYKKLLNDATLSKLYTLISILNESAKPPGYKFINLY